MPCVVCSHTMQNLGISGRTVFWCPRCGAINEPGDCVNAWTYPKLVSDVREAYAKIEFFTHALFNQDFYAMPSREWINLCADVGYQLHDRATD